MPELSSRALSQREQAKCHQVKRSRMFRAPADSWYTISSLHRQPPKTLRRHPPQQSVELQCSLLALQIWGAGEDEHGHGTGDQRYTELSACRRRGTPKSRSSQTSGMMVETSPLRIMMAASLLTELSSRSSKVVDSTPEAAKLRTELIKQQLLTPDGKRCLYLEWSPEKEKRVPTEAEPRDIHQAHQTLQETVAQVQRPGTVIRFHALRALQKFNAKDGNAVIPWKMTIGLREEAAKALYQNVRLLCGNAVTQLVLIRIRPANMKRSGLAQRLSQGLQE